MSSTEFLDEKGITIPGPDLQLQDLQLQLAFHKMISVKKDLTMIIGGWSPSLDTAG